MIESPLALVPMFHLGPVPVTKPVVVTWAIMAVLAGGSALASRSLSLVPSRRQSALELVVSAVDRQIRETMRTEPKRYRALIGTIFFFVLTANWSSLIPGIVPPTAHLETDMALGLIVVAAIVYFAVGSRGIRGYLATFAQPTWIMIPLNVVEHITRTFSLVVRLFGNVMSGVFLIGIVLSLARPLVPIPFMALDVLIGLIQAYIFTVLAMVFIGSAIGEKRGMQN